MKLRLKESKTNSRHINMKRMLLRWTIIPNIPTINIKKLTESCVTNIVHIFQ